MIKHSEFGNWVLPKLALKHMKLQYSHRYGVIRNGKSTMS
ncbi:hypothetical protein PTUN_a1470 [Pseudoalteromonas tunicata]|nr:hypothetical protein PTUN_a1470 [Pseudoalteromonas tunicata]